MKNIRLLIVLASLIVFSVLISCSSAEKASRERQNLMLIDKSDLKRNSPYKTPKKKKTYKPKKHKKKKPKKLY